MAKDRITRREAGQGKQGASRQSEVIEEDEVVAMPYVTPPELADHSRLAAPGEVSVSVSRSGVGVLRILEEHHAVVARKAPGSYLSVEDASDRARNTCDPAVDLKAGRAK